MRLSVGVCFALVRRESRLRKRSMTASLRANTVSLPLGADYPRPIVSWAGATTRDRAARDVPRLDGLEQVAIVVAARHPPRRPGRKRLSRPFLEAATLDRGTLPAARRSPRERRDDVPFEGGVEVSQHPVLGPIFEDRVARVEVGEPLRPHRCLVARQAWIELGLP